MPPRRLRMADEVRRAMSVSPRQPMSILMRCGFDDASYAVEMMPPAARRLLGLGHAAGRDASSNKLLAHADVMQEIEMVKAKLDDAARYGTHR